MNINFFLSFQVFILGSFCISSAQNQIAFKIDTLLINSSILNEDRTICVFSPDDNYSNDSVKLIFLLDGEYASFRYRKIIEKLPDERFVAIGIVNNDRRRDMLPGQQPEKFMGFIKDELMPIMNAKCQIREAILYGHSIAGGFTLYCLLNEPGLFDKYIASSPVAIQKMAEDTEFNIIDMQLQKDIKFYFSHGEKDMRQVKKQSHFLEQKLLQSGLSKLHWKSETYEDETHNSSALISLINGINF